MTMLSVADAMRVGEPLDTAQYNFVGVLTDGQGHPLYADFHGSPGNWIIKVISDDSVEIRNTDLGDLLPDDLTAYVSINMGLRDSDIIEQVPEDPETRTHAVIYDAGGAMLRIDTRIVTAPAGQEAPLMCISLTSAQ